jgi:hypothetical protein
MPGSRKIKHIDSGLRRNDELFRGSLGYNEDSEKQDRERKDE